MAALDMLPDDLMLHIIAACGRAFPPGLGAVYGLDCLCKAVLQQLHRLRPVVRVQVRFLLTRGLSEHLACGPWRIELSYTGRLTAAVVEQASRGRVRSINVPHWPTLAPAVAKRVVPELLGAGCSLLGLKLEGVVLSTWAATFGEAVVGSEVLHELQIDGCRLRGPLPELRLQALQRLNISDNLLTGGLEPLQACTALRELYLTDNMLTGGLEPLKGLQVLATLICSPSLAPPPKHLLRTSRRATACCTPPRNSHPNPARRRRCKRLTWRTTDSRAASSHSRDARSCGS